MADTARTFVRAMSSLWGRSYWVTWHPSIRYRLGEVGTDQGGQFVGISTLAENQIATVETQAATKDDLTWRSEGGVNVTIKGSGQTSSAFTAIADGQAGALVEFTRANGILVAYRGLAETRLASQPALAEAMLRRYWQGVWPVDWCAISHLVTADSGTVLMASNGSSAVELAAEASAGAGALTVADLAANVSFAKSTGLALELHGVGLTPFFRIVRLRKRFVRGIEAVYGDGFSVRKSAVRPAELPKDLLEEARDDVGAVLEEPEQDTASKHYGQSAGV